MLLEDRVAIVADRIPATTSRDRGCESTDNRSLRRGEVAEAVEQVQLIGSCSGLKRHYPTARFTVSGLLLIVFRISSSPAELPMAAST